MVELCIMLEGQMGLNWNRWERMCRAVEVLGFDGLFRSDHFANPGPAFDDALELWTSLTYAASHTQRIKFGPLVTPITFRHPSLLASMAVAVDDLSKGRFVFGIGAGWNEDEHAAFGIPFPSTTERFDRLEEALELISLLFNSDEPVTLDGQYYPLKDAILLPRPKNPGGPSILIGGNGENRTLPMVAKYADEWNAVYLTAQDYRMKKRKLNGYLAAEGHSPSKLRYSMMTGLHFARNNAAHKRMLQNLRERNEKLQSLTDDEVITFVRNRGALIGMADEVLEQIQELVNSGLQRLMLQWLDWDDREGLEALASQVLPAVHKMEAQTI